MAVDRHVQQLISSNDRLQARLAFLEELIGSWQEQGIQLLKPTSDGRDFRFDPHAAYQLPRDTTSNTFEPPLHVEYATRRLSGRARPLLLGREDGPEARAIARWRRVVLVIGLATITLYAILFSRRLSHTSALTSFASPHVVAEPVKPLPEARFFRGRPAATTLSAGGATTTGNVV
jgi:hypothetical protein